MSTTVSPAISSTADHGTAARPTRSLWVWWHLFSLDAPTVAVLWCWFFAAAFGLSFRWVALPTLALGTWCVYVADRLLDGWRSAETTLLRDRHWFYLRHRKLFLIAWGLAAVPLAYLVLLRVRPSVRNDDIVLCLIGVAYFLLIHGRNNESSRRNPSHWFSKELAVGFLFAMATAVPTWTRLSADSGAGSGIDHEILAAAIFTFGAACWLNCVAIQVWEDAEAEQEETYAILSSAGYPHNAAQSGLTAFLGSHLTGFALAVGSFGLCLTCATMKRGLWPPFAAVTLSAILFLLLIQNSHRFRALTLRIAADAALLTPLLFFLRVR